MIILIFSSSSQNRDLNSGPAFWLEFETRVHVFFLLFVYLLFLIDFNSLFSLFIIFKYLFF
jgi:hypothetical protein